MARRSPKVPSDLVGVICAGILLLTPCGCRHVPPFVEDLRTEYFRDFPAPAARFGQSDLVVVGTIIAVDPVGAPSRSKAKSPTQNRFLIEPIRIRIGIENSFKRQPPSRILDVYGYTYSHRNDRQLGHPLPFEPETGQRRLLFLRSEGNRVRLLHDVFDYSLRVFSGRHDGVDPKFASSAGAAISWTLLTRSEGSIAEGFAVRLGQYAWYAHELAGTPVTMELMGRLAADPNDQVREEATRLLSSFKYELQHGVLDRSRAADFFVDVQQVLAELPEAMRRFHFALCFAPLCR